MDIHTILTPVLKRFRSKRMAFFEKTLVVGPHSRVLDVGGTPFNWVSAPIGTRSRPGTWSEASILTSRPDLTFVNLDAAYVGSVAGLGRLVVADGRALPFRDGSFDVVFCNSVIEHVQPGAPRAQFAAELRRVGRTYFVQTPNRWFPLEPHFLTPCFHFLPRWLRRLTARRLTPWGWITRPSRSEARTMVEEISLLGERELREHFPDAAIVRERLLGLPKSLLAIKACEPLESVITHHASR